MVEVSGASQASCTCPASAGATPKRRTSSCMIPQRDGREWERIEGPPYMPISVCPSMAAGWPVCGLMVAAVLGHSFDIGTPSHNVETFFRMLGGKVCLECRGRGTKTNTDGDQIDRKC